MATRCQPDFPERLVSGSWSGLLWPLPWPTSLLRGILGSTCDLGSSTGACLCAKNLLSCFLVSAACLGFTCLGSRGVVGPSRGSPRLPFSPLTGEKGGGGHTKPFWLHTEPKSSCVCAQQSTREGFGAFSSSLRRRLLRSGSSALGPSRCGGGASGAAAGGPRRWVAASAAAAPAALRRGSPSDRTSASPVTNAGLGYWHLRLDRFTPLVSRVL